MTVISASDPGEKTTVNQEINLKAVIFFEYCRKALHVWNQRTGTPVISRTQFGNLGEMGSF